MVIVGTAVVFQLIAVMLACRLLRLTGWVWAWACLSLALVLMTLRLGLAFHESRIEIMLPTDRAEQAIAFLISLLMLIAMAGLIPRIQRWRQAETALEAQVAQRTAALAEANQALQAEMQERQRTQVALAHQSRLSLIGEMTSGLVHEINQPLTAVSLYAEVCSMALTRTPADLDMLRSAVKNIIAQSGRAEALFSQIKHFAGHSPPRRHLLDLNTLVQETVDFVAFKLQRADATLHLNLKAGLPPAWADPLQVQQVLVNLLHNALEALEEGVTRREVTIRTCQAEDPLCVEVTVSDTGPGLSTEVCHQIFQPFFTTKVEGTGLGLAISQSLIKAHGGQLWVKSVPGQGAAFHFTLPTIGQDKETVPEDGAS